MAHVPFLEWHWDGEQSNSDNNGRRALGKLFITPSYTNTSKMSYMHNMHNNNNIALGTCTCFQQKRLYLYRIVALVGREFFHDVGIRGSIPPSDVFRLSQNDASCYHRSITGAEKI